MLTVMQNETQSTLALTLKAVVCSSLYSLFPLFLYTCVSLLTYRVRAKTLQHASVLVQGQLDAEKV